MDKLAVLIGEQIKSADVDILDQLPAKDQIPHTQKIIRGPFSMQSIYTLGRGDILGLEGRIFGVAADYREQNGQKFTYILVSYPDTAKAYNVLQHVANNLDPYIEKIKSDDTRILFKDYQHKYGELRLTGTKIEIKVGLLTVP
jgi:hypothetical protein